MFCNKQPLNEQKSKWELNKKLFESTHFYAIYLFFISLVLLFIGILMMGLPSILVKDIAYSKYSNTFLEIVENFSFFQVFLSIFIAFIYNFKDIFIGTNIITKVKLYNNNLIITNEKYIEHYRRYRPLRTEFISKSGEITLKNYEILFANNKFIKIKYKDGNKFKKIKILIEYFENAESLVSILKEKANNSNKIKINQKHIPLLLKLITIELLLTIIFTSILFIDVKQTKLKLASYQFYASDKNQVFFPYYNNVMSVEYSREKEIEEYYEEDDIDNFAKSCGKNETEVRERLKKPIISKRDDLIKYTYSVNGIKTYNIELYYGKRDEPIKIAQDLMEIMRGMEELEETTIIKCINSIITKNENEYEEKLIFSSGGCITFSLIKYPQHPNADYILEKSYIKINCNL